MSGSVNKVILIGHLGKDPESRTLNSGGLVVSLSLATSETWKDKATGERKERTEWHRVALFDERSADFADKYLKKGAKVFVEGTLATRKYTDGQGIERYTTEVVVKAFGGSILSLDKQGGNAPPPADDPDGYGTTSSYSGHDATGRSAPAQTYNLDDEIPF